jgi:lipopolysaccharide export LptBFGC system permease protein LptF
MKERLLGFLFVGALLVAVLDFIADKLHQKLFSGSLWLQAHWYVPYLLVPVVALLALAFSFGFFRPKGPRWADATALLITAFLVYITVGAAYS